MIARAKIRFLKTSAQKARLVVNQIRGRPVGEALALLGVSEKIVAKDLEKLLRSAVANAQQGDARVDVDRLYISRAVVDQGPSEKRARAGSMGRIFRILKRRCHVAVELDARS
ncbi:MAG: 50S ribosomal protein L22 [Acidobacteria bacterium]|nr:MAG: 50S ribosomal protein L22 [Acidobacteriota bacterium]